ncbi:MAG: DJ-1/PfpI family protein [Spirochaetaceae bacterium]|jgi:4-methyl-5(b-hydroxyethyl)-thiazole monophosphate biosynthesis|nr:DJ-1/PfpI family protein [Spirochaetaceae bacterium]
MTKKVFVFLADGFEEVETITPIDFLRRAGAEVTTVSISDLPLVNGAHSVVIAADKRISEFSGDADAIVLPGGMPGAVNLAESRELDAIIRRFHAEEKLICAICAAPSRVLAAKGLLAGRKCACYPGSEADLPKDLPESPLWQEDAVVIDGHFITSRSAGSAPQFSLAIIERLFGRAKEDEVARQLLLRVPQPPPAGRRWTFGVNH